MNQKKHGVITGASAFINLNEGTEYSTYDGYIKGKNLKLIKNQLIVQSWRASDWQKEELDSIFIIHLEQKGDDVILFATHANLPDRQAEDISKSWIDFYWEPWKKHIAELQKAGSLKK